jgi:hypothetical protein
LECVRIAFIIGVGGFLLLSLMEAVLLIGHDGLGALVVLYLDTYWTGAWLVVGFAWVVAAGLQRLARRLRPSH